MSEIKLLLVEDTDVDIQTFNNSLNVYKEKNNVNITLENAKDLNNAFKILDNTYDGIIIDIRLHKPSTDEGIEVIKKIQSEYRIPIAVFTGNPGSIEDLEESVFLKKYIKGEVEISHIISELLKIYNTGITKVLGSRGTIEEYLNSIFWKYILPGFNDWIKYHESGDDTESALLRWTVNHIQDYISYNENTRFFPCEAYVIPKINDNIQTGEIIKDMSNKYFIIITPACDLELRENGEFKTDHVLLSEIENSVNIFESIKDEKNIKKIKCNSYSLNYHYLPDTERFLGGVINFRKIKSMHKEEYKKSGFISIGKVTDYFLKDIISRFSIFYARQGQPEFILK